MIRLVSMIGIVDFRAMGKRVQIKDWRHAVRWVVMENDTRLR